MNTIYESKDFSPRAMYHYIVRSNTKYISMTRVSRNDAYVSNTENDVTIGNPIRESLEEWQAGISQNFEESLSSSRTKYRCSTAQSMANGIGIYSIPLILDVELVQIYSVVTHQIEGRTMVILWIHDITTNAMGLSPE